MNGLAVFCRATYRKKTLLAGIAEWSAPARRKIFSMRKSNEHSKSHVEGNTIPGLRIIPNYLTDQGKYFNFEKFLFRQFKLTRHIKPTTCEC
jgi:hypothetical protein